MKQMRNSKAVCLYQYIHRCRCYLLCVIL